MPKRGQRMRVESSSKRARYCRMRLRDPVEFDPRSLRTKTIRKGVKLIVGCPAGKYAHGRCAVGTMPQSLLKLKVAGRCPAFKKPYKYVK